jgi:hypothetical protein
MRQRGGIISSDPINYTPSNVSGVFTLNDARALKIQGTWPNVGPIAPTALVAPSGNGQFSLSWTAPATTYGAVTGYVVQYSPVAGGVAPQYVLTGSASNSYNLTGLTNGTAYVVRVAAINANGWGMWSVPVVQTPAGTRFNTPLPAGWTGAGTAADPLNPANVTYSGGVYGGGTHPVFNSASFTAAVGGTLRITHPGFWIDCDCDTNRGLAINGSLILLWATSCGSAPPGTFYGLTRAVTAGQTIVFTAIDCYYSAYDKQFRVWIE